MNNLGCGLGLGRIILEFPPSLRHTLQRRRVWHQSLSQQKFKCNLRIARAVRHCMLLETVWVWLFSFKVQCFGDFLKFAEASDFAGEGIWGFLASRDQSDSVAFLKFIEMIDWGLSVSNLIDFGLVFVWSFSSKST